jgi:orotidine-5'-phosphate decarboxylase
MRVRFFLSLDVPTASEALTAARAAGAAGWGVRVGSRLLSRVGPPVVTSLQSAAPVLVDARLGGSAREAAAAARSFAALGAGWVTVDGRLGDELLASVADSLEPRGASIVAVTIPPEAPDPREGRGKAVSTIARDLDGRPVTAVLGQIGDIGVIDQVAPGLGVVVIGTAGVDEAADALARGAVAVIVDDGIARSPDPASALSAYGGLAASADTIPPVEDR